MDKKYIKLVTVYTVALSPSLGCTRPSAMGQLRLIVQLRSHRPRWLTQGTQDPPTGAQILQEPGQVPVQCGEAPSRAVSGGAICGGGPGYPQNTGYMDFSLMEVEQS